MKQEINYTNFEAFYLDLFEGNLSEQERNELVHFLERNPSLKTTIKDLNFYVKSNDLEKYPEHLKENLYQYSEEDSPINPSSLSFFQAAYIDEILSQEKQCELELFEQSNPTYKQSANLFAHTKLVPDFTIVFEDKLKLKKQSNRLIPFGRIIYSLAAACVLGFVILNYKNKEQTTDSRVNQVVNSTPKQIPKTKINTNTSTFSKSIIDKESRKVVKKINVPSNEIPENHKNQSIAQETDMKPLIIDSLLEKSREESKEIKQQEEFAFNSTVDLPIEAESETKDNVLVHKRFPIINLLATKLFNRNVRIGKKSRLKSDEYYLVIGSFQVTRNISR
jgi:hypothetical protein